MSYKQKLELTWIGKGDQPKLEPRILLWDKDKSYGDENTENMLIHGDNLLALKALEQEYTGKIKCIYIDPPYNTGSAFEHYDDNLEHSTWLSLMKPRLDLLRNLLSEDGSIWISIDDEERDYLKVLCDEVFGRRNFITANVWQKIHSVKNDARILSVNHDYILIYAKKAELFKVNLLPRTEDMDNRYKNPDDDPRGPWQSGDLVANEERVNGYYDVINPINGKTFNVPKGKHWVYSQENMQKLIMNNEIWFGKNGTAFPRKKRFLKDVQQGRTPDTWWKSDEVGHNQEAKRECKIFNLTDIFATPKPERLIERILTLGSNEGDIVLDSFLGSGTTAAVAHKMKRRWIGIELGDHCYTHCKLRLEKVVDGEQGGISKAVGWQGGGGFKFYELAPSLLKQDTYGNWVIDKDHYNAEMLAAAVAKLNGYRYEPHETVFWKQGKSHENSYIFATTQYITAKYLDMLSTDMQHGENLLICCPAYDTGLNNRYDNIIIKKIPQAVLDKCEFGVNDYNINLKGVNSVEGEDEEDE